MTRTKSTLKIQELAFYKLTAELTEKAYFFCYYAIADREAAHYGLWIRRRGLDSKRGQKFLYVTTST